MADQEPAPTLDEIYRLTKENHRMLKAIRRDAFIGHIVTFVVWAFFLVVIPYITWLYVKPYVDDAVKTYQNVKTTSNSVSTASNTYLNDIQNFFNQFAPQATTTKK